MSVQSLSNSYVSYALVPSGPEVATAEVESHLETVEVKVSWGSQVLAVRHLETGKGFSIGEGGDFVVPNVACKTDVVGVRGGSWFVSVPAGATATVCAQSHSEHTLNAGEELEVRAGVRVAMNIDGVTIEISAVRAGKKLEVGFLASLATGAAAAIGLSFFGHTAIVASLALFMPSMGANDAESIDRDQMLSMQTLMDASADREQERLKEEGITPGGSSPSSEPTKGEPGTSGTPTPMAAPGRVAVKGKDERSEPTSRQDELAEARTRGMIEILRNGHGEVGHDSPWGEEPAGQDERDARGTTMWNPNIGEVPGGGFGPSGTGDGGGGKANVIAIDGSGSTVGRGKGGFGDKDGFGNDHGMLKGEHAAKAPAPREGIVRANGQLPAEVIQRIVRQNFGRFRLCYEAGLRGNPTLQGRIVTKFVIGRDGSVLQSADGGSDLQNPEVVSCVVKSFQNISFPTPEAGVVTVSYPISFQPGE